MNDEITRGELASLAAVLAGPGASHEQITQHFARASLLLLSAGEWLSDDSRREADMAAAVLEIAEEIDAADPVLPWSDPKLHALTGYDIAHPNQSPSERGRLLWDCFDKAVERTWGRSVVQTLREKYRAGIQARHLAQLWPRVSKYRRDK